MALDDAGRRWSKLDKDLKRIGRVEQATQVLWRPIVAPATGLAFIALAAAVAILALGVGHAPVVAAAAAVAAYMALNVGANDVANNVGPAVGARALTMGGALLLAAVCESAGALLAGANVVATLSHGIVAPASTVSPAAFVTAMMAALVAAALWVNLATLLGAPVSTTHSVVGGVVGAGVAAAGPGAVDWSTTAAIAASWVTTPLLGGAIAALLLAFINWRIVRREDKLAAARRWVPVLFGVMTGAFGAYLTLLGLRHVLGADAAAALAVGATAGVLAWGSAALVVRRRAANLENRKRSLKVLFALPLVASAALLSFAHGANDVANAVGPLAAIVHVAVSGDVALAVAVPPWVMVLGACGISLGLFLFGPRLVRMVGAEITRLNPIRACCVALAAAVTVIVASALGLPVSSTHVVVGGVFGVGFFREWDEARRMRRGWWNGRPARPHGAEERARRRLVRRSHFLTIVAAWIVTVPAAAALSAAIYLGAGLLIAQ